LLKVTIVCSDPCEGWPCFECEMMVEAISMALKGATDESNVDFTHQSVEQASAFWKEREFNDLDAPYFLVDDEVKLHGRGWREASVESVISILSGAQSRR
jgi:hypothetical protein